MHSFSYTRATGIAEAVQEKAAGDEVKFRESTAKTFTCLVFLKAPD